MKNFNKLMCFAVVLDGLTGSLPAKDDVYFRDNDRDVLRNYFTSTPTAARIVIFYSPGASLPDTITNL